ncbi:Uncharacterised protein [Yersinia enterocolitica]|nr:hypothetical protein CH47_3892 [Yersinia enterocolitica]VTP84206.1 Uncharacterised protein [Yersinia enterocolitica subsp. enterocolitica]KGA69421.1 hypothetical protein DJ59_2258 [Yersinia enterocolitica]CNK12602.1 Uncharacterised protein [Yersinia enterocolitica]SQA40406.1 Uncharacterised protein [Yersinia enterocolitica]
MDYQAWVIQRRIGKGAWKTISKGLPELIALKHLDELISNKPDVRYQYRMLEERRV